MTPESVLSAGWKVSYHMPMTNPTGDDSRLQEPKRPISSRDFIPCETCFSRFLCRMADRCRYPNNLGTNEQ